MGWTRNLKDHFRLLARGGPGFVQIALTNACNARCRFCSFPGISPGDQVMADPERLLAGLPRLAAAGVRYGVFTGGEPLLYPQLDVVLQQAKQHGIQTMLCTNGWQLDPDRLASLRRAGVSHLIISIDAASEREHDENRGLPGLCSLIRRLLPEMKRLGLKPVASVTVSRLIGDFKTLGDFLVSLGFKLATFSYPLTELHSSYLSYARHASVTFTAPELVAILGALKDWKLRAPVTVLNPSLGITELQRQLCGLPGRFPCLAGYKYFYIDWELDIYRCHYLPHRLGPLEEFGSLPPARDNCHACLMDCYRDASVQQYLAVALGDAWGELRQGNWGEALGRCLRRETVLSLGALRHSLDWLGSRQR